MEHWRRISLLGIILGIAVMVMDFLVAGIPYIIIIPLEIVSIVLIFAGFIIRKNEKGTKRKTSDL